MGRAKIRTTSTALAAFVHTTAAALVATLVVAIAPTPVFAAPPRPRAAELKAVASPKPAQRAPSKPGGDFSHAPGLDGRIAALPDDAVWPDGVAPAARRVTDRTASTTTYDNGGGRSTVVVHGGTVNFEDEGGVWRQIDTRLHTDENGDARNGAGPVRVRLAKSTSASDLVSLAPLAGGWSLSSGIEGLAGGRPIELDGSTGRYREVLPGIDLEEQVMNDRVKETFVIRRALPRRMPETIRFPLRVDGLTPQSEEDGSIAFKTDSGATAITVPVGIATDSSTSVDEHGLTPRAPVVPKLVKTDGGWAIDVVIPTAWVSDPARVFPVYVDPPWNFNAGPSGAADQSVGSGCGDCYYDGQPNVALRNYGSVEGNAYVNRVGWQDFNGENPCAPGSPACGWWQFYSYLKFPLSSVIGHQVVSATFHGRTYTLSGDMNFWPVGANWNIGMNWQNKAGHMPGVAEAIEILDPGANTNFSFDITDWARKWADGSWGPYGLSVDTGGDQTQYSQLFAMEQPNVGPYIAFTLDDAPTVPTAAQLTPADGTVTTNPTPTLSLTQAMTDANGDAVRYWFRIATGADGESGQVINSGWLTPAAGTAPTFPIPEGALLDGTQYYWRVYTSDNWASRGASPPVKLKLNLRLGESASPTDSYGPVSVNLATGNLHYSYDSPAIASVGGPIGLSLDYNSKSQPAFGLTGTYWDNCNGAPPSLPLPPAGAQQKLVRRDPRIDFQWSTGPAPFIASTHFCAQWSGYVTFPGQNTWYLGAASDDGVRITLHGVNNTSPSTPTTVLDRWSDTQYDPGSAFVGATGFTTTGSQTVRITIDYYNNNGPGGLQLRVAGGYNGVLPADWLSPAASTLPQGWSMSAGAGVGYVSATVGTDGLVLTEPDGSVHEYRKAGTGSTTVWKPVDDGDAFVSQYSDATGTYIVAHGEDGVLYTFDSKGKLRSAVAAVDDTKPAAPTYSYDPATGHLNSITDPVSGRVTTFAYSDNGGSSCGFAPPEGFAGAPGGFLCKVSYGDAAGTKTNLYYNDNGQLARVEDWASNTNLDTAVTDLGYDTAGRLASVRDPLAADSVAFGQRADDATVRTAVAYDGETGRAIGVTLPAPTSATDARPSHSYAYTPGTETRVTAAGSSPTSGYVRRVVYDGQGRTTEDYDAAGLATKTTWDAMDGVTSTTDPSGLETATLYDVGHPTGGGQPRHLATDVYGPAPSACFNPPDAATGVVTPKSGAGACPAVPRAMTGYDESMPGLAVGYYSGLNPSGAPAKHDTGLHAADAALDAVWATPPAGLPAGNWSMRMTGEVNMAAGSRTFSLVRVGGARLFIDDELVLDSWSRVTTATTTTSAAKSYSAGWHRVMVDFQAPPSGTPSIQARWTPSGGATVNIPDSATSPRYALTTSATDPDGKKTATRYADASRGIGPEFGLATAIVTDPDADGLALTTSTAYEAPSATTYLRRLSKTMPKGAEATTSYVYYGASNTPSDTVPSNDCGGVRAVGMLKQTTDPTPASGGPIVRQVVYDSLNRVVGTRVSAPTADQFWSCTSYDARGRVESERDSKGVVTTISHAVPGEMTTIFNDSSGAARTTVAKVSLTGQQTSYTDEHGTTTRVVYDQLGRATDSYRAFAGSAESHLMRWAYDPATMRLASLSDYSASQSAPRVTAFSYDAAGRLTTKSSPNGVVTTTGFDAATGAVASVSHKAGATELSPWSYTRTAAGRVAAEATTGGGRTRTRAFSYDGAARLFETVEATGGSTATRRYSYDANSNRCSSAQTCDASYAYDNADRLTASPFASSYAYDSHGNMTSATPRDPAQAQQLNQPVSLDAGAAPSSQSFPISVASTGTVSASLGLTAASPDVNRTGSQTGLVAPGQSASAAMAVDGQSRLSGSLSWPSDSQTASDSETLFVQDANYADEYPGSNVATKVVPATGTGTISATVTASVGDHWVERSSSGYGQVPALGHRDLTFSPNANGFFGSRVYADNQYGVSTLSQQLLDEGGNILATAPATTRLFYEFNNLPAYGGSRTFTLRLLSASPTPSNWYVEASYSMHATLTTELLNPSGNRVALGSQDPAAPVQTLSYNSTAAGNYTLRITTADAWAEMAVTDSYPVTGRADVTLQLKDSSGNVVAQDRTSSGSASVAYSSPPSGGGGYTWQIVNHGPLFDAAWSLAWSATTLADVVGNGSIVAGGSVSTAVTADGSGYAKADATWTKGSHQVAFGPTSLTVPAGQTATRTISPDAPGPISATYAWGKDTAAYSSTGTVAHAGTMWGPEFTVSANGSVTLSMSWSQTGADLDLEIIDKATGAVVWPAPPGINPVGAGPEQASFNQTGLSYGQSKTYQVRVTAKAIGGSYTLSGSYPVWDRPTKLEILDAGGSVVASVVPPTSGTASATVSYASGTAQAYTVRVTSGGRRSTGTVSGTHQLAAFATVTAALKDSSGATIASATSSSGALSLTTSVPAAGTYSLVLANGSSDIAVPAYSLTVTLPRQHQAAAALALKNPSGAVVATGTAGSPTSLTALATKGVWTLVVTPVSGAGSATLTASYPGAALEVIEYDGRDHATSIDDGLEKVTETLSPSGRVLQRKVVDSVSSAVKEDVVFGYDGEGDSPSYSRPASGGPVTTFVNGPDGLLLTDTGGAASWLLANAHGDAVGTVDANGVFTPSTTTDEFGVGTGPPSRLGWLGSKQRFGTGGSLGLVRMGVRLYDPALGRFLGVDPVEGGCANDYAYVFADPVNTFDLDGRKTKKYKCDGKWQNYGHRRNREVGEYLGTTYIGPGQGGVVRSRYVTWEFTQYRCQEKKRGKRGKQQDVKIEYRTGRAEQLQVYVGGEFGPIKAGRTQSGTKYFYDFHSRSARYVG